MNIVASFTVPAILASVGLLFLFSKSDLLGEFIEGAREGLKALIDLLPTLVLLIVGVSMLRVSGGLDIIGKILAPFFNFIGVPEEVAPFVITRPFTGAGSTAMLSDIFNEYGADSYAGVAASVIMGCSETVFYVFAVYFGAAKVKKTRFALPAALITAIFASALACYITRIFFGF
ncbi:spore maturation protein [Clostridia bacterium]|nr:spore maturation protein [Clostridia bacterium]